MSRPTTVTLTTKEQKEVLKEWKTTKNARKIAEKLKLPRAQVMIWCENQNLCKFSDSSYC